MKEYTVEEFLTEALDEFNDPEHPFPFAQVNGWLERGDGVAVYQNEDLGHYALGRRLFVSFGSAAAQIPLCYVVYGEDGRRLSAFIEERAAQSFQREIARSLNEAISTIYPVATAPTTCPDGLFTDTTGGINWRYQLQGTYKGPALPDPLRPLSPAEEAAKEAGLPEKPARFETSNIANESWAEGTDE